ncbi:pirin family protein [mine drainage metagenome]|uniref:Pirin family protein n=2 Tax=mine drainage metagenome TaxID=410659 RepID=T1BW86_9ZZZZ
MTQTRLLQSILPSIATSDGAGVKLKRSIGQKPGLYLDPFLMLDAFGTEHPEDYIQGFPSHPHRGFETVTYMLEGHLRHEDHLGHVGDLGPGGVQWMTAGRGIIHSEMPMQTDGCMRGFQLWINLPSARKMDPPSYRDIDASEMPVVECGNASRVRVIAGSVVDPHGQRVRGPIERPDTEPLFLDLELAGDAFYTQAVDPGHHAFLYPYEGSVEVGPRADRRAVPIDSAGILGTGTQIEIQAGAHGARVLLLAGRPLGEAVVQYGPFVMNTRAEIERAIHDYQSGHFVTAPDESVR